MLRHHRFVRYSCALLGGLVLLHAALAHADIHQWEYVNPGDPSQGIQESSTLASGGAGVDGVPAADLTSLDLSMAYLVNHDLTSAHLSYSNLTNAALNNANLSSAFLPGVTVTGATFTGVQVQNAVLTDLTGFVANQLYSTASYASQDLSGIYLSGNDMTGWNFTSQNLSSTFFSGSTLAGASLNQANLNGAFLLNANASGANFNHSDLTAAYLAGANLTNADLSNSTLSFAYLAGANLTGTNLSHAQVQGASFGSTVALGFTKEQLYSTDSYIQHDLSAIELDHNDLSGWDFSNQVLEEANFMATTLNGASFSGADLNSAQFDRAILSGAILTGAVLTDSSISLANLSGTTAHGLTAAQFYTTANYKAKDLTSIILSNNDLSGWNFSNIKLTSVDFSNSVLAGADFTGANITSANFSGATQFGFLPAQLYATSNYQQKNLSKIKFDNNNFAGWNFSGQNLMGASFLNSLLAGANFEAADTRDATSADFTGANTTNMIFPDGHVHGLNLGNGQKLVVNPTSVSSTGVTIDNSFVMGPGGILQLFPLQSKSIVFSPNISVQLGGILDLEPPNAFETFVQGNKYTLFNWSGVTPQGTFDSVGPYLWNTSHLYTDGYVTFIGVPEPTSATLLLAGATGIMWRYRKRRFV